MRKAVVFWVPCIPYFPLDYICSEHQEVQPPTNSSRFFGVILVHGDSTAAVLNEKWTKALLMPFTFSSVLITSAKAWTIPQASKTPVPKATEYASTTQKHDLARVL